jgi:hypothetical protein
MEMFMFTLTTVIAVFALFFLSLGSQYAFRHFFVFKPARALNRIRAERINRYRLARKERVVWKKEHYFLGKESLDTHEEHQRLLRQEIGALMLFLGYATDLERCSWHAELTRLVEKMSFEKPTLV